MRRVCFRGYHLTSPQPTDTQVAGGTKKKFFTHRDDSVEPPCVAGFALGLRSHSSLAYAVHEI